MKRYKIAKSHLKKNDDNVFVSSINKGRKNIMMNTILTGSAGAGGIELIGNIPVTDNHQQIGQLVLQILVAIITIIKLVKDKKNKND